MCRLHCRAGLRYAGIDKRKPPHKDDLQGWQTLELTQPRRGGGGGLGLCRAAVPPHRVCRVTRGRRCVVLCCAVLCCVVFRGGVLVLYCACAPLLCHLCPLCHHDMEGGGGGAMARYAMQWFV